jgi:uncharacterized protein (UPF0548 family)
VFLVRRPSPDLVQEFIASQSSLPFSYADVGATAVLAPPGYRIDHNRTQLGAGGETYDRAVSALKHWQQFNLGWVRIVPPETALELRAVVAVEARAFGLWSLNAVRVIYTFDEQPYAKAKFGFAYGTLPDHVEEGEERFTVEWLEDDSVWYDLYAFSRPRHRLAKVGFPLCRMLQKRFARDSMAAMENAVR